MEVWEERWSGEAYELGDDGAKWCCLNTTIGSSQLFCVCSTYMGRGVRAFVLFLGYSTSV